MPSLMSLLKLVTLTLTLSVSVSARAQDPVHSDPGEIDRAAPPGLVELTIPSAGHQMVGHLYTANGPGPHPTVVMLHGFPGNEKNLDLAQALRRAGFNTLYFHYRGAWGSGGTYSVNHVIEDAHAALAFVRAQGKAGKYRIDPARVSLFGHSLGGFNAIITGAHDKEVSCTVAAAPADLVPFVKTATSDVVSGTEASAPVPGLDGYSFADLVRETQENAEAFDLVPRMASYGGRALMIVSGDKDKVVPLATQTPLAVAAQNAGASPFEHAILDADHGFSWGRFKFMDTVVPWMQKNCQ